MDSKKTPAIYEKSLEDFIKEEKRSKRNENSKRGKRGNIRRRRIQKPQRNEPFRRKPRPAHLVIAHFIFSGARA